MQLLRKRISKFPKPLSLIVPKDHIYRWKFVGCAFNTGHNYCQVWRNFEFHNDIDNDNLTMTMTSISLKCASTLSLVVSAAESATSLRKSLWFKIATQLLERKIEMKAVQHCSMKTLSPQICTLPPDRFLKKKSFVSPLSYNVCKVFFGDKC